MLHGIIPPLVTPFTAAEDLDLPRLKSHIDFLLAKGCHGVFIMKTPE
jgi:4-hydroxy-tetrahydrodipicolinate synthase